MRTLFAAAAFIAVSGLTASAQDVAKGEISFHKCLPCHSIGDDAQNKIGPELNGLDGRHSGTVAGFMNMIGGFGGMITPILIPVLLASLGGSVTERWKGVFLVLSTVWFLGASAWLFIDAGTPLVPDEEGAEAATH